MRSLVAGIAVAVLLAACGGPTPYQPAAGGEGFSEQRLEADRFRVQVAGNSLTSRRVVQDHLLYRAAELTLQNGYQRFVIVSHAVEPRTDYYTYPIDPFPHWFDRHGWWGFPPYYETDRVTRYEAWAEIKMYNRAAPPGANVYDARAVITQLRPRVLAPNPG